VNRAAHEITATIFDIKRYAIHDGPGIRTTVFFKGCPLSCWWCHNPEGQKPEPEVMLRACHTEGKVVSTERETVGSRVTLDGLMGEIEKETIFHDESGGGVTLSGGEPLMQFEFLSAFLDRCRERGVHTTIDTCGYAPPRIFGSLINKTDLFLYDLKFVNEQAHKKYTGVSNKLIIENLQMLAMRGKKTYVRYTIIPGITDTDQNLRDVVHLVSSLDNVAEVDLLPYYNYAGEKYKRLRRKNRMSGVEPPSTERMRQVRQLLRAHSLKVKIGG
jgi:pyruvate formate lyase activating enzyme